MRLRTKLAWAWLAFLSGAFLLGKGVGIGPLAWFETWFAVATGRLLGADILFGLLILSLPSLWILFDPVDQAAKAKRTPAARISQFRTAALVLLGVAGGCLAMAAYAGLQIARLPGGGEEPIGLNGTLAEAAASGRPLRLTGVPVAGARAEFVQPSRQRSSRWAYEGFQPGARRGDPASAAPARALVALFVERRETVVTEPYDYVPPAQDEVMGYLVEDGLPAHARTVLAQGGVTIAAPHYLLKVDENGLRGPWYTPLLLGLIFAFVFGAVGAMLLARVAAEGRRIGAD